jgi:hypothetical protein
VVGLIALLVALDNFSDNIKKFCNLLRREKE